MEYITEKIIEIFKAYLIKEEKSEATIQKYLRDIEKLIEFVKQKRITMEVLRAYKEHLKNKKKHKTSNINTYLSAANSLFRCMGWDLKISTFRIQEQVFVPEECELADKDYKKLLKAAGKKNKRLELLIMTMGSTGMRVSELEHITVESLKKGVVEIYNKGKVRNILLPKELQKELKKYIKEQGIKTGIVFRTRSGKPLDCSNIWKEMQKLAKEAGIDPKKVHPHNLRHLFARMFYKMCKDIAKLADILGHSSIETTRKYLKSTTAEIRDILDKMDMCDAS